MGLIFLFTSGAVFLAVIAPIVFLLSPWIKPEVWLTEEGLFIQKYFKSKKLPLEKIDQIKIAIKGEPSDFGNFYHLTLKIILKDGSTFKETRGESHSETKFSFKELFQNYDEFMLPRPETLKKIIQKHPIIKIDEYVEDYIKTGEIKKFKDLIN